MYPVPAISAFAHVAVAAELAAFHVWRVLDVGGNGRLRHFGPWDVVDANLKRGVDGCRLPYGDHSFDAVVSVATVEHVADRTAFLSEARRVARSATVHWYPAGEGARRAEALKRSLGHCHPCSVPGEPSSQGRLVVRPLCTVGEHLIALASIWPRLNVETLHRHIIEHGRETYGVLVVEDLS